MARDISGTNQRPNPLQPTDAITTYHRKQFDDDHLQLRHGMEKGDKNRRVMSVSKQRRDNANQEMAEKRSR